MQQIISFLIKNSYRMLFLLLLTISLSLAIQSHSYHKSKIINSANYVSGSIYSQAHKVEDYFDLKTKNEELALENARLKNLIFNQKDSLKIEIDSVNHVKKTELVVAKVIKNCYTTQENTITIDAGKKQGLEHDMGVINSLGIVGVVDNVSNKYATVMSILNINSRINAKMKKSNHFGTLVWNGKNTGFVQLIDIPRLASVKKGDTVVTGNQSTIFPENINIGTVNKVYIDTETTYYTLEIKLFNDMTSLGHVYVLKNVDRKEIKKLEEETEKEKEKR